MPGNTRISSPPRRISSTAIAAILPVTRLNWRSNWPVRSVPSSISVAASAAACRTCARFFPKPRSSAAILRPRVLPSRAGKNPSCCFASMDDLGADAKFDLVIASCVFHHIPPQDRQMAIRYCYSRLKDGGHFIIFEHNPINPVTRHLVKNCPFDADAVLLGMRETVERMRNAHLHIDESSYCLFFPQQLSALRPFEKYLRWLPMGGQYFVCASNQKRDAA